MIMKKLFYPILWLLDMFNFSCYLEIQRFNKSGYDPYDFTQELTYGVEPPLYVQKLERVLFPEVVKNPSNNTGPR